MRLIDADALIDFIDMGHYRNPLESCFSERDVVYMLERCPTIEVEPVKHGEWRIAERDMAKHTVLVECSECDALLEIPMTAFGLNYDYCPNCGAKMDQEEECH